MWFELPLNNLVAAKNIIEATYSDCRRFLTDLEWQLSTLQLKVLQERLKGKLLIQGLG